MKFKCFDVTSCIAPEAKNILIVEGPEVVAEQNFLQIHPGAVIKKIKLKEFTELNIVELGELFDCIIYLRVLENICEPVELLKSQKKWLSEKGKVAFIIANTQDLDAALQMLRGEIAMRRGSFSLNQVRKIFAQAEMKISKLSGITSNESLKNIEEKEATLKVLRLAEPQITQFLETSDFIVEAAFASLRKPLLIQTLLGETKVCSRVRIEEPHSFLRLISGVKAVDLPGSVDLTLGNDYERKVFIWQRTWPRSFAQQEELIRRGYLIIAEIDDDPMRWHDNRNQFMAFVSSHAVQVSTEALAESIRQWNPNVIVFKNQMAILPPLRKKKIAEQEIVLFFGALNREADWQELMEPLNRVVEESGRKCRIVVIHDRKFFESLTTENKVYLPMCSYEQYRLQLANSDIAFLPLQNNSFNSMKSDLKYLECAAWGVAALASPTVYEEIIVDGDNGMIYNDEIEFEDKLRRLLQDDELRFKIVANAYGYVQKERMLWQHYLKRLEWYDDLIENYDELTKQIYLRMQSFK